MTLLQLKVAVAAADQKSLTAAARVLGISQPNASSSLKLLEEEVGFPILLRSGSGSLVTPRGEVFLRYARQMLDAEDQILSLRYTEENYRLHLGTVNYYAAAEPFFTLCAEHREEQKADFRYCNVSVAQSIQALTDRELDVVAAPVLPYQVPGLQGECRRAGLTVLPLCRIPAVIQVRRDHPAALDGRLTSIVQGSDLMKDYPYVGIRNLAEDVSSTGYSDSDYIACSGKIFADDTNARLRLIESTNGFGFGVKSSYRMMSQFNLAAFPVPGVFVELFCLYRPEDEERREIKDYISLLRQEMDRMLG